MTVLVVNAGSTSLKLSLVDQEEHSEPVRRLEDAAGRIGAVAHRIVHGGASFGRPCVIDDEVAGRLSELVDLAPLHNAPAVDAVRAAREALPGVPHVAVFDTFFHGTIPSHASTYALPERFREEWGIRRFGFHGLSVAWTVSRVPAARLVVCHLGGGCSVTAVRDGRSLDTTMGFTPLEGVPMATRAGSVDPGALLHVLRRGLVTVEELDHALEHESGLLGLGGSSDPRDLRGSEALDVYAYRIATAIGGMVVALGGLDALVFTAGVGEGSADVRGRIVSRLAFLGAELDEAGNAAAAADAEISSAASRVRVHVVHAREDVVAARLTRELLPRGSA